MLNTSAASISTLDQHRLLQVRRHAGDLELVAVEPVGPVHEHRQQPRGRRALRAAQRMRPSKSFTDAMPLDFFATIANGGWFHIM
jgi:hypothetical protein